MRRLPLILALTLALPAAPLLAATPTTGGQQCSASMINSVNLLMPPLGSNVNVNASQLSCTGLAQVYFLLTRSGDMAQNRLRQRILSVFRGEGLIS